MTELHDQQSSGRTAMVARLYGVGDVRVAEETVPVPGPGQSLVEVTSVGLCGSDLHWYTDGAIGEAQLTRPLVGGHEFAGVVRGGPRDGQRVAVDPSIPCLGCDMCARGYRNLCRNVVFAGHSTQDGGLRQFLAWPDNLLHALPDHVSDSDGAMLEPLGVAIHAFDLGHVGLGASAAIIGCGPIGLCLLQVLRVGGVHQVIATDPLRHRRAAAERLGADVVLDPASLGYTEQLRTATDGIGVDVAFEVAGSDDAIKAAIDVVRPGGRVVLVGIPSNDRSTFPAGTARRKGLSLVLARRMNDVYPRAMSFVSSGRIDVASLVTHRFPLAAADHAFRVAVDREGLKVIVVPNADV
jgi:L-iditol 2-dehydrogenase